MAEQFYTILTNIGKAKIANATSFGTKVNFTDFALGDGNGNYYNPTDVQTGLVNEVWRGQIGQIVVDENNPNWIVLETVIPAGIGGFTIREAGVFDDEGSLLAVGKYPETYKPLIESGSAKDLYVRMILEVSNASVVTLKIDQSIILATKKDIDVLSNRIKKNEEDILVLNQVATEMDEVEKKITKIEKDIDERWGKTSKNITGMDLNNLIESGIFSGSKLINAPTEGYYYVDVIQMYTGANVYQRLRAFSFEGRSYERNQVNGKWQEWKMVANEDDIEKTSDKIIGRVTAIEQDIIDRWGKKSKKIDGMDLDTLIDSGIYVGTELINAPTNYYCYVEVIAFHSTSGAYQRVRSWGSSGRTYERSKVNSNWQEWKQVANQDDIKIVRDRAEAAFQSASEGKKVVAGAITGKGVPTSPTDTFQKMATNIVAIKTDTTGDATALAGDILKGKTAYSKGNKLVGTMPNHGMVGKIISTEGGQVKLEEGYYELATITARFANLTPPVIKKGINVGGVVGSYEPTPKFKKVYVDRLDQRVGKDIVYFPEVKGKPVAISVDLFYIPVYGRIKGESYFEENPYSQYISLTSVSVDEDYKTRITASTTSVSSSMTPSENYSVEGIHILYLLD